MATHLDAEDVSEKALLKNGDTLVLVTQPENNSNQNNIRKSVQISGKKNNSDDNDVSDHYSNITVLVAPKTRFETSKLWMKRIIAMIFSAGIITILVIILVIVSNEEQEKKKKRKEEEDNLFPIAAPGCDHPIYCRGELLASVQKAKIFKDQKTFVDMPIRKTKVKNTEETTITSAAQLLALFQKQVAEEKENFNISQFVETYFAPPGSELVAVVPADFKEIPSLHLNEKSVHDKDLLNFSIGVHQTWKSLLRAFDGTDTCDDCTSFLAAGKNPFVIPGGRFTEYYYWDTYWIVRGLLISEMYKTAWGVIDNFLSVVEKYGFVPNGARVYYLSRSQPPMLSDMVDAFLEAASEVKGSLDNAQEELEQMASSLVQRALPLLIKEHSFWVKSKHRVVKKDFSDEAVKRVLAVNAPRRQRYSSRANSGGELEQSSAATILDDDYMLLNRFWVSTDHPRPESYSEDMAAVDAAYPNPPKNNDEKGRIRIFTDNSKRSQSEEGEEDTMRVTKDRSLLFSHLAAGAESGYDYTVRWFENTKNAFYPPRGRTDHPDNARNTANISTIQAMNIIPADLNSILLRLEERIATWTNRDVTTNNRTNTTQFALLDNLFEEKNNRREEHKDDLSNETTFVVDAAFPSYSLMEIPTPTSSLDYLISPLNGVHYDAFVARITKNNSLFDDAICLEFATYAHRRRRSMLQILMAPPADAFLRQRSEYSVLQEEEKGKEASTSFLLYRLSSSFSDFNIASGSWLLTEQTERSLSEKAADPFILPSVYFAGFATAYAVPSIVKYHLQQDVNASTKTKNPTHLKEFINDMRAFIEVGGAPASNASVFSSSTNEGDRNNVNISTPQQWDFANGWAPNQYFISKALALTRDALLLSRRDNTVVVVAAAASEAAESLRKSLLQGWINNCYCGFQVPHHTTNHVAEVSASNNNTSNGVVHALMEKYLVNSANGSSGHGGEYEVQLGFGWTNGLVLEILAKEGEWLSAPPKANCAGV